MDVADELSGTFRVPRALVALVAIITGILILFFPYILNILIAFFLVVWGLLKAAELGSKPSPPKPSQAITESEIIPESDDSDNSLDS